MASFIRYLVEWRGYPLGYATWEPLGNLSSVIDCVERFERAEAVAWPAQCDGALVGQRVLATFLDEYGVAQWYKSAT